MTSGFVTGGLITLLTAGCGDGIDLGEVSGVVRMDGKPLPGAMVSFEPETGRSSAGRTDAEGRYALSYDARPGALVGRHTVKIVGGEGGESGEGGGSVMVPARYNMKSALSAEVIPGQNVIDFDLTSGGPAGSAEPPKESTRPANYGAEE